MPPPPSDPAEIVDTLAQVTEQGMTILCAQYAKSSATWIESPAIKTRAQIVEFAADGWRSANLWIVRDFVKDDALPDAQ